MAGQAHRSLVFWCRQGPDVVRGNQVGCQSAERAGDWQCFLIECVIQHGCIYDNTIKFIHRWIFFFLIWVMSGCLVPRTFVSKYFFQWDISLSQIILSSLWKLEIGPQAGRIRCELFILGRPAPQFYPRQWHEAALLAPLLRSLGASMLTARP